MLRLLIRKYYIYLDRLLNVCASSSFKKYIKHEYLNKYIIYNTNEYYLYIYIIKFSIIYY